MACKATSPSSSCHLKARLCNHLLINKQLQVAWQHTYIASDFPAATCVDSHRLHDGMQNCNKALWQMFCCPSCVTACIHEFMLAWHIYACLIDVHMQTLTLLKMKALRPCCACCPGMLGLQWHRVLNRGTACLHQASRLECCTRQNTQLPVLLIGWESTLRTLTIVKRQILALSALRLDQYTLCNVLLCLRLADLD